MRAHKSFVILFLALLLSSCIVKSLFTFYTDDTIFFEKAFLGTWRDMKDPNNKWIVASVKEYNDEKRKHDSTPPSPEDIERYNKEKDAYFIINEEKDKVAIFSVMPFKIKGQLFLDFTPLTSNCNCNIDLFNYHQITTHSLVKFDMTDNDSVSVKWFSSEKLQHLIETHDLDIEHKKFDSEYLLTASSEELQKFIKNYMDSDEEDKWKTDVKYDLVRTEDHKKSFEYIKKLISGMEKIDGIDLD